jgi:uncharacterized membrane protein
MAYLTNTQKIMRELIALAQQRYNIETKTSALKHVAQETGLALRTLDNWFYGENEPSRRNAKALEELCVKLKKELNK